MKPMSRAALASLIDHTMVLPQANKQNIEQLCAEAREHQFYGVCVNGSRVELARTLLEDSGVKVTALVGFPFGAAEADVKRYETETAIDEGAHEIEMVINIGRVKDGHTAYVLRELRDVAEAADERPVKVILESSLLTSEETLLVCHLALDSGVHFVSTGTGLPAPATAEAVRDSRAAVGKKFGVKAAGGIENAEFAQQLVEAGATRLGTTNSVALILGLPA
jgi:deoxyribose-phosphate aldolase